MVKASRNQLLFYVLTFVWTWAWYAPIVLSRISPYEMPGMIFLILGGAGPSIVGVALVLTTYNKDERRDYWQRVISFRRISPLWWLIILLIYPLILAVSSLINALIGGAAPGMEQFTALIANPLSLPMLILLWFMSGPIAEELGWRGYALDPMLTRFGAMRGSILLGLIWGVWHLPLFFMPATWHGQMGFQFAGFWTFLALNVGNTLIFTWVYSNTKRSILSAIFLHFMANFTANMILPISNETEIARSFLLLAAGLVVCAMLVRGQPRVEKLQPAG